MLDQGQKRSSVKRTLTAAVRDGAICNRTHFEGQAFKFHYRLNRRHDGGVAGSRLAFRFAPLGRDDEGRLDPLVKFTSLDRVAVG